ncbi:hypothetical protein AB1N83_010760 [Pleurotus pulmonarius]
MLNPQIDGLFTRSNLTRDARPPVPKGISILGGKGTHRCVGTDGTHRQSPTIDIVSLRPCSLASLSFDHPWHDAPYHHPFHDAFRLRVQRGAATGCRLPWCTPDRNSVHTL